MTLRNLFEGGSTMFLHGEGNAIELTIQSGNRIAFKGRYCTCPEELKDKRIKKMIYSKKEKELKALLWQN